jgi:hypothetical protein
MEKDGSQSLRVRGNRAREVPMPKWVNCTANDGTEIRVNLDHVAMIRPYKSDRGFTGSEIIFATGTPSSIVVQESPEDLAGPPDIQPVRGVV